MAKHRISDNEVEALLRGDAIGVSPELSALAQSLSDFRAAAFETVAQPTAALTARLRPQGESELVTSRVSIESATTASARTTSRKKRVRRALSWFTGLGLLAKILLGSTVAAAAVVSAGAGGVLPGGAQDAFDTVVSLVAPNLHDGPDSVPTGEPSIEPNDQPTGEPTVGPSPEPTEGADTPSGTIPESGDDSTEGADDPSGDGSDPGDDNQGKKDKGDKKDKKEHSDGRDSGGSGATGTTTDGNGGKPQGNGGGKKD